MTDNALLQQIADDLVEIKESQAAAYADIVSAGALATHSSPLVRAANNQAVKTVVTNEGPSIALVHEGGVLVKILDIYESWVSPAQGKLAISVQTDTGHTAQVTISTYIK